MKFILALTLFALLALTVHSVEQESEPLLDKELEEKEIESQVEE